MDLDSKKRGHGASDKLSSMAKNPPAKLADAQNGECDFPFPRDSICSEPPVGNLCDAPYNEVRRDSRGGDPGVDIPLRGRIGVAVRVRPQSTIERANPSMRNCIQCMKDYVVINKFASPTPPAVDSKNPATSALPAAARPQQFHVDKVFHSHSSQIEVYEQSCRHIVEGLFHGINGSILAYGATGSGKTHTMFGGPMSAAGIVYQAVKDIFDERSRLEEEEGKTVKVRCSFIEIYNDTVFDLIVPPSAPEEVATGGSSSAQVSAGAAERLGGKGNRCSSASSLSRSSSPQNLHLKRVPLQVCEVAEKGDQRHTNSECLKILNLQYVYPNSVDEFARFIETGHVNRFVAATGANAQSSRSHVIIMVEVRVMDRGDDAAQQSGTVARIYFCDLAGSERAADTSNSGLRLRESGSINRSLLALGSVVQSLLQKKRNPSKSVFVPYRDSKLTRLLRDGIGNNCHTQMLFCLNPGSNQYEESINTMLFSLQVKEIEFNVKRNIMRVNSHQIASSQEAVIEELRAELAAARCELLRLGGRTTSAVAAHTPYSSLGTMKGVAPMVSVLGRSNDCDNEQQAASGFARSDGAADFLKGSSFKRTFPGGGGHHGLCPHPSLVQLISPAMSSQVQPSFSVVSSPAFAVSSSPPVASSFSSSMALVSPPTPGATRFPSELVPLNGMASIADSLGNSCIGIAHEQASNSRTRAFVPSTPSRQGGRPSIFSEHSLSYTQLENKLKAFTLEKESLYHQMRDAQEKQSECDIRLREMKWKLAQFFLSSLMGGSRAQALIPNALEPVDKSFPITPVGVAGLRQLIDEMEKESITKDEEISELSLKLDQIDRCIATTRQEVLCEKQQPMLELLLDNAKLRQSCTEAESLAAHYHQQCRVILNRKEEYAQALSAAVGTIRALLPLVPHTSPKVRQAKLTLLYSKLPTVSTADMITTFESALYEDCLPPPLPPLHPPACIPVPKNTPQLLSLSAPPAKAEQRAHPSERKEDPRQKNEALQRQYEQLLETVTYFKSSSPSKRNWRRSPVTTSSTDDGTAGGDCASSAPAESERHHLPCASQLPPEEAAPPVASNGRSHGQNSLLSSLRGQRTDIGLLDRSRAGLKRVTLKTPLVHISSVSRRGRDCAGNGANSNGNSPPAANGGGPQRCRAEDRPIPPGRNSGDLSDQADAPGGPLKKKMVNGSAPKRLPRTRVASLSNLALPQKTAAITHGFMRSNTAFELRATMLFPSSAKSVDQLSRQASTFSVTNVNHSGSSSAAPAGDKLLKGKRQAEGNAGWLQSLGVKTLSTRPSAADHPEANGERCIAALGAFSSDSSVPENGSSHGAESVATLTRSRLSKKPKPLESQGRREDGGGGRRRATKKAEAGTASPKKQGGATLTKVLPTTMVSLVKTDLGGKVADHEVNESAQEKRDDASATCASIEKFYSSISPLTSSVSLSEIRFEVSRRTGDSTRAVLIRRQREASMAASLGVEEKASGVFFSPSNSLQEEDLVLVSGSSSTIS